MLAAGAARAHSTSCIPSWPPARWTWVALTQTWASSAGRSSLALRFRQYVAVLPEPLPSSHRWCPHVHRRPTASLMDEQTNDAACIAFRNVHRITHTCATCKEWGYVHRVTPTQARGTPAGPQGAGRSHLGPTMAQPGAPIQSPMSWSWTAAPTAPGGPGGEGAPGGPGRAFPWAALGSPMEPYGWGPGRVLGGAWMILGGSC